MQPYPITSPISSFKSGFSQKNAGYFDIFKIIFSESIARCDIMKRNHIQCSFIFCRNILYSLCIKCDFPVILTHSSRIFYP
ncbi:hypothetical protein BRYFOR_09279 [Marvinbryantia formatexigens DSM 14469]|uniref:Uncharacterized protein n=1 Tax=Marvinbryantia formatexigens DSM 14469 TaxID=478749 RepID=C6LKT1_9FIRM|nr:hypothetical protein BRYFOR_09279 [Marvinbryantia formatexigens DSM 14469]